MQVLQPTIPGASALEVEEARLDDLAHIDLAVVGLEDLGAVVELLDEAADRGAGLLRDHARLVEDDDVGKLDLVDEQIGDGAFVLGDDVVAAVGKQVAGGEVVVDGESVEHSAGGVQLGELFQPAGFLETLQRLKGAGIKTLGAFTDRADLFSKAFVKGFGDLLRLTDTAALDDDVVKFGKFSQPDELFEKVTTECAANAAILKGDDFLFGLGEPVCALDQVGVDVDPGVPSVLRHDLYRYRSN